MENALHLWVEYLNKKCVPMKNMSPQKAWTVCKESPGMNDSSHLLHVRGSYRDLAISLDKRYKKLLEKLPGMKKPMKPLVNFYQN
jgi:hypothetical protein